jgi:DNA repair exonuclease SbcCD ATPase subunit
MADPDSRKLKHYMRHLVKATKRHYENKGIRQGIYEKLTQIRKAAQQKPSDKTRKELLSRIDELNKKISLLVDDEKRMMQLQQQDESLLKKFDEKLDKIENAEKQQLEKVQSSVFYIKGKVDDIEKYEKERKERRKELEKKIKAVSKKEMKKTEIRKNLAALEERYKQLKAGDYSSEALERIKNKIEEYKAKL